jgi:hypothetical protein
VTVLEVDLTKRRIGLSLKTHPEGGQKAEDKGPKTESKERPKHDGNKPRPANKPRPVSKPPAPVENSICQLLADFSRQQKAKDGRRN